MKDIRAGVFVAGAQELQGPPRFFVHHQNESYTTHMCLSVTVAIFYLFVLFSSCVPRGWIREISAGLSDSVHFTTSQRTAHRLTRTQENA